MGLLDRPAYEVRSTFSGVKSYADSELEKAVHAGGS